MKMKHIFVALVALLPLAAVGQNLNPTVEVSKSYEGKLTGIDKPLLKMAVPDSLYRFDLDFDYSVTETPYQSSYEFRPYAMEMVPMPTVKERNVLRLRAGAGYQLHPELDFVWSPSFNGPFRMNVYASHRSFVGDYWKISPSAVDGVSVVSRAGDDYEGERTWSGYDFVTKAGVNGRYDWTGGLFRFDASYEGMLQKDWQAASRNFYAFDVKAGAESKYSEYGLGYKIDAAYRYAEDFVSNPVSGKFFVKENDVTVDAGLIYGLDRNNVILLDFGVDMASTDGLILSGGIDVDVVPHYVMNVGNWRFDLGARISAAFGTVSLTDFYGHKEQIVYPDVKVEYMVKNLVKLYMNLGGDSKVDSYSDMIGFNRRADMNYGRGVWDVIDVSEEKINAFVGAEGRIGNRFCYDAGIGYAVVGNALLDGVVLEDGVFAPALGYTDYDKAFAKVDWLLDLENFRFDGNVVCNYAFDKPVKFRKGLFFPPVLEGDVSFTYNWKKRVFAGVDCSFATDRRGSILTDSDDPAFIEACIPGYADLGVNAEYVINRSLGVWLRGGNLLGMTLQRSPFYAEKGPYFTVGITWKL